MTLLRDISVTSFCLASSAYLYLLHHRRTTPPLRSSLAEGYILTNQVTHARLLPVTSKHAFSYHTLSLLLSLSALENGSLNIGWGGIVFGYPGIWGRVCGLRPETYVRDYGNRRTAIRSKLADLLKPSGMKLGEVWMMTMPSFLGFEGINPLTVYFCYDEGKADVWGLVLEVHNTFGERHAYVLQVGKGEDGADKRSQEYDHQWTFPRQFHVSPFNDRSGHYVCSVIMPSHPPHSSTTSEAPSKPPRPVIRLHLLTAPPTPQLKLVALLRPILAEPLTARTLLGALVLPPFGSSSRSFPQAYLDSGIPKPSSASWSSLPLGAALLLTSLRIIYQAAHLHYHRGLAVFARPEPKAGLGREWVEKALGGVWNDVQPNQSEDTIIGGSIGWQSESPTERWARERFKKCMEKLGVAVRVASTDPLVPITLLGAGNRQLTLCYRTPRTWTSILLAPTAEYALEIGSRAERWFSVSDEALFCELWNKSAGSEVESSWVGNTAASIRARLAYTTIASPERPPPHPLDNPASPSLLLHLCLLYIAFHAERLVFLASKARFVKGDTPWRVWDRIGRGPKVGAGGVGSIKD